MFLTPTNKLLRFVHLMQQHDEWLTLITVSLVDFKVARDHAAREKEFKEWA